MRFGQIKSNSRSTPLIRASLVFATCHKSAWLFWSTSVLFKNNENHSKFTEQSIIVLFIYYLTCESPHSQCSLELVSISHLDLRTSLKKSNILNWIVKCSCKLRSICWEARKLAGHIFFYSQSNLMHLNACNWSLLNAQRHSFIALFFLILVIKV